MINSKHSLLLIPLLLFIGITATSLLLFPKAAYAGFMTDADKQTSFEGVMTLSRYVYTPEGEKKPVFEVPLTFHPDYILVDQRKAGGITMPGNIHTNRVLVRQKEKEFLFFSDTPRALLMKERELKQLIEMYFGLGQSQQSERGDVAEPVFVNDGKKKNIRGMETERWIISFPEEGYEWHLWISDELVIPWGILSQRWISQQALFADLPIKQFLDEQKIPLKAQHFQEGNLVEVIVMENISTKTIDPEIFQTPDHVEVMSFQEMIFNSMRNR